MTDATGQSSKGERNAIARRAGIVAAGTLSSRLLGMARDMVFAAIFSKAATDLFFVAFTIPNALRALLGEGAVSSAVVPVFSEVRKKDGEDAARQFHARITGAMLVILGAVSVIGILAAWPITFLYAAGYLDDPERFNQTVTLTRLLFPYIFFMGIAALGMGGLNSLRRFAVPAFAPALLNVAFIAAAFWLVGPAEAWGLEPIAALAIGALIGGALQVIAQWPELRRVGLLRMPIINFRDPHVRKVFRLMIPLLAGLGIYQLNVMLGRLFATFLEEGSQSYIYYGNRLVEIPQGMLALAIAAAALPTLSDLRNEGKDQEVKEIFTYGLRLTLFLAIPSTVAIAVLAEPIISVIFARGAFGRHEVLETTQSLWWQAAGVWAIASVRTTIPMFYAYNDTRSPVVASGANLLIFAAVTLSLMGPLGHVGIAIGLSTAGIAQLFTLLWLLRRRVGRLGLRNVVQSAVKTCMASTVMGAVLWVGAQLGHWEEGGNHWPNIALLLTTIVVGSAVYFMAAKLLRSSEMDELWRSFRRRIKRTS